MRLPLTRPCLLQAQSDGSLLVQQLRHVNESHGTAAAAVQLLQRLQRCVCGSGGGGGCGCVCRRLSRKSLSGGGWLIVRRGAHG